MTALSKLQKHKDKKVAEAAVKALLKWSPEFKRKHDVNKAYEGPGPIASSDLEVESSTPLFAGQLIQFQENGSFWYAGRIKKLLPNNKVLIEALAWGKPNRELTLARRNLQLAPPEVDQPRKRRQPPRNLRIQWTFSQSFARGPTRPVAFVSKPPSLVKKVARLNC